MRWAFRGAFHATSRSRLASIRRSGLTPVAVPSTANADWSGRPFVYFGTSLTYVVPYANDYVDGAILRFPFPQRYLLNPDQDAHDAEGISPDPVPPEDLEIFFGSLTALLDHYEGCGGIEREGPDRRIEQLGSSRGCWMKILQP